MLHQERKIITINGVDRHGHRRTGGRNPINMPILNDGALPTEYHIEEITALDEFNFDAETNELLVEPVKDMEPKPAMLKYTSDDSMSGCWQTKVPFAFRPRQPESSRVLKVTFDGSDVEVVSP